MQTTWPRSGWLIPLDLGLWSAAIAVTPGEAAKLALAVPVLWARSHRGRSCGRIAGFCFSFFACF
jgi:hypothetical protein